MKVLKELDHPNINKFVESFDDVCDQKIVLILEFCTHGSLAREIFDHTELIPEE